MTFRTSGERTQSLRHLKLSRSKTADSSFRYDCALTIRRVSRPMIRDGPDASPNHEENQDTSRDPETVKGSSPGDDARKLSHSGHHVQSVPQRRVSAITEPRPRTGTMPRGLTCSFHTHFIRQHLCRSGEIPRAISRRDVSTGDPSPQMCLLYDQSGADCSDAVKRSQASPDGVLGGVAGCRAATTVREQKACHRRSDQEQHLSSVGDR